MSTDTVAQGGAGVGPHADQLMARAKAPARENLALMASRLCGDATVTRSGDEVTISARRAPVIMQLVYVTTLLLFVFAMVAVILLSLPLLPWAGAGVNYGSDAAALNRAGLFAAVCLALNQGMLALAGRGTVEDVRTPLSALRVSVMGLRRRRYLLQGPVGARGRRSRLILDAASDADNELLRRILSVGAR